MTCDEPVLTALHENWTMSDRKIQELGDGSFIRQKLHAEKASELDKYQQLVTGRPSRLSLLHYELVTFFLCSLPGAVGLLLRRWFYGRLFKRAGRGLTIGRNVVIRHADNIQLGDRVVIDDNTVIDARGAGDEGLAIGDDVIIGRGAILQCKAGAMRIGEKTSIGAGSVLCSMGGLKVGRSVMVAGGCEISGGQYHTERLDVPIAEQGIYTYGPVTIGDGTWLAMGVIVLDAVSVGRDCAVGAGAVVTKDLPDRSIAVGVPARVIRERSDS